MGMGLRPATPTEPFIPPGFSDKKATPNAPKVKAPQPKKKGTNGYEGDNEKGRLRKTKGQAAPGYGSDSSSSSKLTGARKSQKANATQAKSGGERRDKASPIPVGGNKRAKGTPPSPQVQGKSGAVKGSFKAKASRRRSSDGVKPKAAAGPNRQK